MTSDSIYLLYCLDNGGDKEVTLAFRKIPATHAVQFTELIIWEPIT